MLADGTCLFGTEQNRLQLLTPAGQIALIAGDEDDDAGLEDGESANTRSSLSRFVQRSVLRPCFNFASIFTDFHSFDQDTEIDLFRILFPVQLEIRSFV